MDYVNGILCEVYTNHRSLQHLFKKKDLNLRQIRWLELLKDYEITSLYHPSKANIFGLCYLETQKRSYLVNLCNAL